MKKILLLALTGMLFGAMAFIMIGSLSSCSKDDYPEEKARLAALILEAELLDQNDYTAESWAPLDTALRNATDVITSHKPAKATLDAAIDELRDALKALVRTQ
jgi:hypothetical protein